MVKMFGQLFRLTIHHVDSGHVSDKHQTLHLIACVTERVS